MDRSFTMRQLGLIALVSLAIVAATLVFIRSPWHSTSGDPRLDAVLKMAKDQNGAQRLAASPLILINFWASWCGPCLQETPSLIRFAKAQKGKLAFVSISQDTVTKDYTAFLKIIPNLEEAADLLIRDQDQSLGRLFGVESLPDTFIYSPPLKRYFRLSGSYDWDRPETMAQIEKEFVSR